MARSVVEQQEFEGETQRRLLEPALEHLIRLEIYFRLNGLDGLASGMEAVLQEAEGIMVRSKPKRRPASGKASSGDTELAVNEDTSDSRKRATG
jgi:hypothetical protein